MAEQPAIGSYSFGRIEIDGRTYTSDVIILPGGVRSGWRRAEGHRVEPVDLAAVLEASPAVLVIGQGAYGAMQVTHEALGRLRQAGIATLCLPTAQAAEVYNERRLRGEQVAAALHLTC